jgi:hypothetical protein
MPKGTASPIICARRNCTRCSRWRHITDFRWRWSKQVRLPNGRRVETNAGEHPYVETVCTPCRRKRERRKYHENEPQRRHINKRTRSYHMRRQDELNRLREEADKLRTKNAMLTRELTMLKQDAGEFTLVPLLPFRMWLLKRARELGGLENWCYKHNLHTTRIHDFMNGYRWEDCDPVPIMSVKLDFVDKVLLMDGTTSLATLYPLETSE